MKKLIALLLAMILLLCLVACGKTQKMERPQISNAPVAKFEYINDADDGYKLITSEIDLLDSFDDFSFVSADGVFSGEWLYKITFFPQETNPNDTEIIVMFGESSVCVDGQNFIPENGVEYSTILTWAADKYDAFDYELVK